MIANTPLEKSDENDYMVQLVELVECIRSSDQIYYEKKRSFERF